MESNQLDILKQYLSDDEVKEIVIQEYKTIIRENLKKIEPNKIISDYDRVIGNAVYSYLHNEIDNIVGGNSKEIIESMVKKILESNSGYNIFRTKSAWDKEDSIGQTILKEAVINNKKLIIDKVNLEIENINFSHLKEDIKEYILEVIDHKLKA